MMPDMADALAGFEDTLQFQIILKTVKDGEVIETSKVKPALWFEGVLQPLHPRELLVKSEGERKFKWFTLFTDLALEVDAVVKDEQGATYRVMASSDWAAAGYFQYQLIEGPAS